MKRFIFPLLAIIASACSSGQSKPFHMVRLYTGEDGLSHFEEVSQKKMTQFSPGVLFSDVMPATGYFLETFTQGFFEDWHNPPDGVRYLEVILEGSMRFIAGDGTEKVLSAGDLLFFEDLTGKGHQSYGIKSGRSVIVKLD